MLSIVSQIGFNSLFLNCLLFIYMVDLDSGRTSDTTRRIFMFFTNILYTELLDIWYSSVNLDISILYLLQKIISSLYANALNLLNSFSYYI